MTTTATTTKKTNPWAKAPRAKCRACDTEDNYCTHCCLDYQARVENQEAERETEFKTQVLHEQAPETDITKYIKPGVSLYDVICHWTADRGGEEELALFDLEDPDDAELFMKARGIRKYLDCRDLNRYWFDGLNDRFKDGPLPASGTEMVRLINTQVLDRIREERENGDDVDYLWDQVFEMGDMLPLLMGECVMDAGNGHNASMVAQINEKWDRFKENFKPILLALYERDAQEIYDCKAFHWGDDFESVKVCLREDWDFHARTYLMNVADDQDLETILTFVRYDVCEGTGRDRQFISK